MFSLESFKVGEQRRCNRHRVQREHQCDLCPFISGFLENDIALMKLKERILIRSMHGVEVAELPDISVTGEDWPKAGQVCGILFPFRLFYCRF